MKEFYATIILCIVRGVMYLFDEPDVKLASRTMNLAYLEASVNLTRSLLGSRYTKIRPLAKVFFKMLKTVKHFLVQTKGFVLLVNYLTGHDRSV